MDQQQQEVLAELLKSLLSGDLHVFLMTIMACIATWYAAAPHQAMLEHAFASAPWMPKGLKTMTPLILSLVGGYLATHFGGLPPAASGVGALVLAGQTHLINESESAVSIPGPDAGHASDQH